MEWGSNDVEVLLANFAFHKLSFDKDWKCEYFDKYQFCHSQFNAPIVFSYLLAAAPPDQPPYR